MYFGACAGRLEVNLRDGGALVVNKDPAAQQLHTSSPSTGDVTYAYGGEQTWCALRHCVLVFCCLGTRCRACNPYLSDVVRRHPPHGVLLHSLPRTLLWPPQIGTSSRIPGAVSLVSQGRTWSYTKGCLSLQGVCG